jgi:penicillin-binding protein
VKNKKTKIIVLVITLILVIAILGGVGLFIYFKNAENKKSLNTPEDVIGTYTEYLNNKDYSAAYELLSQDSKNTISKDDFVKEYEKIYGDLGFQSIEISNSSVENKNYNDSNISYVAKMKTSFGEINYDNKLSLKKQDDKKYYINWDYETIYPELKKNDKIDIQKKYAKRGSLIDRNGVLLAGGGYNASIGLVPGWMNEETKTQDIAKVAELLGMSVESINKKMSASYVKEDTFVELTTVSKDSQTLLMSLKDIKGIKIKDIASRTYPAGASAAHLTGYVQKANADDLKNNPQYDENSVIGRTGLEKVYEERLRGIDGYEINLVDEKGNSKKTILKTEKADGEDIKLTIDSEIQKIVYDTYAADNSATVVMNPKTGEILALVSTPSFNPNKFVIGMSSQEWNELSNNSNNPLYARFLRSYAPGSSFKPVTAAIALQTGALTADTEMEASGTSWQKDNSWGSYFITTLKTYAGPANILNALINSDNIFFAKTALRIGSQRFEEKLKSIGFENDIEFDMGLANSKISNEGKFTSEVQLADSGYGQGQIQLNPVHFASIYSSFVNEGKMIMPYLEYRETAEVKYLNENAFSKETAETIKNDLIQVVESPDGTAHPGKIDGVTIAGKTGTAETKAAKGENAKEIGWYNAFIADPNSQKQYLIVSMVENVENKGGSIFVVNKVKSIFEKIM